MKGMKTRSLSLDSQGLDSLSLDIETLVELTPEDAQKVNGGMKVSSVMPSPATGVQPTPTAVSSVMPPAPKKKHHHHHR
jgi:hypothetical protein